jgi:hypothetical protein
MKLFTEILESEPESPVTAKSQNRPGSIFYSGISEHEKRIAQ